MLAYVAILWILVTLEAPAWCFWCIGIGIFISIVEFGAKLYEAGKESR